MAVDKNGKPLPKGITYRSKENRYMGRFMYHSEAFTVYVAQPAHLQGGL